MNDESNNEWRVPGFRVISVHGDIAFEFLNFSQPSESRLVYLTGKPKDRFFLPDELRREDAKDDPDIAAIDTGARSGSNFEQVGIGLDRVLHQLRDFVYEAHSALSSGRWQAYMAAVQHCFDPIR